MYRCEECGVEFEKARDINSKRFCCEHHRRIWIGRHSIRKRISTGNFISPYLMSKAPFGTWKCCHCGFIAETKRKLFEHKHNEHSEFCKFGWNKGLTKDTNEIVKHGGEKASQTLKEGFASGRIVPHFHSEEFKRRQSERAKKRNLGGWYSTKRIDYNGVIMQSSYEVEVAKSLDENHIHWERPKPFEYKINEVSHKYYPDFYLPDYNVYLDPKNDFLINNINPRFGILDSEKIKIVEEQNGVRILILDKNNLDWEHIRDLIDKV